MLAKSEALSASPDGEYKLDEQIGFRLRVALQLHTDIFFRNMQFGITQAQLALMVRLIEFGPCSQNRLGRLAALDSASIVGVMNRLSARKFVKTKKDPADKRRVVIDLTAEGRKVTLKAMALGRQANNQTLAPLNAAQRSRLLELLTLLAPTEAEAGDDGQGSATTEFPHILNNKVL
jgi:DNA-binding MarR family transcriptional regulator